MLKQVLIILKKILPSWVYKQLLGDWGEEGFKKYFSNTSWMFFAQIIHLVAGFFIGAWLARYLGPANYGTLNYALSFVGMFSFVANLGVGTILSRDLVKYPDKRNAFMGTSFVLLLFGGLLAFVLTAASAFIFEEALSKTLIIIYAFSFLWSAFGIIQIYFQSQVQSKKNAIISTAVMVVSSLLKITLILTGQGLLFLIGIFLFDSFLSMSLAVVMYLKDGNKFKDWRYDKKLARVIFRGGWLLMLAAAASHLFMKVDQVMIKHILDESAVGFYAAAVRLAEIWYFIPGMLCASLLPAVVNAKKVGKEAYHSRLRKLYGLLAFVAVAIALMLTILSDWIIVLLFGPEFAGAGEILRIYAWSGVGLFVLWGMQQAFLTDNKLVAISVTYFSLMVLNVVLNLVLLKNYGLTGAAWATLVSYSMGPVVFFVYNKSIKKSKKEKNSNYG